MPRMLFHAPAAAICWSTYEASKAFFQNLNEEGNSETLTWRSFKILVKTVAVELWPRELLEKKNIYDVASLYTCLFSDSYTKDEKL